MRVGGQSHTPAASSPRIEPLYQIVQDVWVGARASLDACGNEKNFLPPLMFEDRTVPLAASRNTGPVCHTEWVGTVGNCSINQVRNKLVASLVLFTNPSHKILQELDIYVLTFVYHTLPIYVAARSKA